MLKQANKVTLFDDVVLQIQNLIQDGKLKPGLRLPSERELATQLGVSRNTLREALKALKLIGVLKVLQGEGTFINENLNTYLISSSTKFISLIETNEILSLLEARKTVEIATAYYAAERAESQDINQLEKLLTLMRNNYEDTELFTKYDVQFHLQIAATSKNPFLVELLKAIREPLLRGMVKTHMTLIESSVLKDHEAIYNCIKNKLPKDAADAMRYHLERIEKSARASLEKS